MSPESGGRRRGADGGSGDAFGGGSGCIGGAVPGGCSGNGSDAPFPVAGGFSCGRFSRSGDLVAPAASLAWVAGSACSGYGSAAPFLAEGAGRMVAPVAGGFSGGGFSRSGDSVVPAASIAWVAGSGAVLVAFAAGVQWVQPALALAGYAVGGFPNAGAVGGCSLPSGNISVFFRAMAEEIRMSRAGILARIIAARSVGVRDPSGVKLLASVIVDMFEDPLAILGGSGIAARGVAPLPSGVVMCAAVECPRGARPFAAVSQASQCRNAWNQSLSVRFGVVDRLLPCMVQADGEVVAGCPDGDLEAELNLGLVSPNLLVSISMEDSGLIGIGGGDASPRSGE